LQDFVFASTVIERNKRSKVFPFVLNFQVYDD